jgi:hypothetical protein
MAGIPGVFGQSATPPQTARQALVEMFFGKAPGTLAKHLPAATLAAFEKAGTLANIQQYSAMMTQLQTQGQSVQTFDTGSVLLEFENSKLGQKAEITVENDALRGDQDDIEITFHMYKNGHEEASPLLPHVTFSMKQEEQVWKLNEISVTLHVPLADPDFLKAITDKMKAPTTASTGINPRNEMPPVSAGSDAMVLAAMHTILKAEATYAATYPTVGYTCSLSDLDGFGGGQPNEHQAMLINSGLASGKRFGFVFVLSGCEGAPANSYHLTATPGPNTIGRKAFCSDPSGTIRSSNDSNQAACLAGGTPVQ